MRISVVIPTWRRPDSLARCLDALEAQARRPDQLVLSVRPDDEATRSMLATRSLPFPLAVAAPEKPGLIAALNAGLSLAGGDIVAFTDDDTVPHDDWLGRIEARFEQDPRLGGLGGRDRLPAGDGVAWEEADDVIVGRIRWFGRVLGNHHLGRGAIREVDTLKGANMAFRRDAVASRKFDTTLRGNGAEHHSEVELCLALKARGWEIAYDPEVLVDHHEAVRHMGQRETRKSAEEHRDAVHNLAYGLLKHLSPPRRLMAFAYGLLVGTRDNPGLLLAIESVFRGHPPRAAARGLWVTVAAHADAVRSWRRSPG